MEIIYIINFNKKTIQKIVQGLESSGRKMRFLTILLWLLLKNLKLSKNRFIIRKIEQVNIKNRTGKSLTLRSLLFRAN